ncbi:hypothetical protein MF406_03460 [Georgenia sp. TF02-10]|uniref:hypothetical protein n=1 Tax=Georgenia sp. TF02-10 TaxID=2917725 RepID=UPI001FA76554|nr:hypothetical protein [Georgenia sp. TF02-10]UNX55342.1 hypothetical protein MF406_03460 [Georgenia sp. TF02-10]
MRQARPVTLEQARDGLEPALSAYLDERFGVGVTVRVTPAGLVVDRHDGEPFTDDQFAVLNSFMAGYVTGLGVGRRPVDLQGSGERLRRDAPGSAQDRPGSASGLRRGAEGSSHIA